MEEANHWERLPDEISVKIFEYIPFEKSGWFNVKLTSTSFLRISLMSFDPSEEALTFVYAVIKKRNWKDVKAILSHKAMMCSAARAPLRLSELLYKLWSSHAPVHLIRRVLMHQNFKHVWFLKKMVKTYFNYNLPDIVDRILSLQQHMIHKGGAYLLSKTMANKNVQMFKVLIRHDCILYSIGALSENEDRSKRDEINFEEMVKYFLEETPQTFPITGFHMLRVAVHYGFYKCVKYLLDTGLIDPSLNDNVILKDMKWNPCWKTLELLCTNDKIAKAVDIPIPEDEMPDMWISKTANYDNFHPVLAPKGYEEQIKTREKRKSNQLNHIFTTRRKIPRRSIYQTYEKLSEDESDAMTSDSELEDQVMSLVHQIEKQRKEEGRPYNDGLNSDWETDDSLPHSPIYGGICGEDSTRIFPSR